MNCTPNSPEYIRTIRTILFIRYPSLSAPLLVELPSPMGVDSRVEKSAEFALPEGTNHRNPASKCCFVWNVRLRWWFVGGRTSRNRGIACQRVMGFCPESRVFALSTGLIHSSLWVCRNALMG